MTLTVGGRDFAGSLATTGSGGLSLAWHPNPGFTWAVGEAVAVSLNLNVTPPGAPGSFSATPGPAKVDLAWANPSDADITKYQYRQSADGGSSWSPDWKNISGSGASTVVHTVAGLTNGTEYTFQIRAANAAGTGAATDSVTATPAAANPAPAFTTKTATLEVAENTGSGDNVGAPVTATDADNDPLAYSLSGTDAESFAIDSATGQITVASGVALDFENPGSDDGDNEYSVTVSVLDGEDSDGNTDTTVDDTITVTINVTNAEETGTITLSPAQPVVGTVLKATLTDPDGGISGDTWVLARSSDWDPSARTGTWSDMKSATSANYTPVTDDVGHFLRMTASYTDGHGSGKEAEGVSANAVLATAPAPRLSSHLTRIAVLSPKTRRRGQTWGRRSRPPTPATR